MAGPCARITFYQDPHEQELRFTLHYGDMTDATNLIRIVQETQPDEIYNLAAQSHAQDRNTRRMLMASVLCGCSRPSEF
jgi:GDP-D-mannose dehydratase